MAVAFFPTTLRDDWVSCSNIMKTKFIILGLLICGIALTQQPSKKKIINDVYFIEILDSSAVDENYAPMAISKNIAYVYITPDGRAVHIVHNGILSGRTASVPDIRLSANEFNDFSDNDTLYSYLKDICQPNFAAYQINYHRTSANFIDSMFFVYGSDTVFHQYNPVTNDTTTGVGVMERH